MRKIFNFTTFIVILLSSLFCPEIIMGKTLTIAAWDFCPSHCYDKNKKSLIKEAPGFVIEIYQAIFKDVQIVNLPFNRGMQETDVGRFDAVSLPLKFSKAELKDKIRQLPRMGPIYTRLIYTEKAVAPYNASCFFVNSDSNWKYKGIDSIKGNRLGTTMDYEYGKKLNAFFEKVRSRGDKVTLQELTGSNIPERNLLKLKSNRVDLVMGDKNGYQYVIKQMEKNKIIPKGSLKLSSCVPNSKTLLYIGFTSRRPKESKRNSHLFDLGIERLRKSGKLQEILLKYDIQDWE
ncbi:hypothetical protein A9Q84_13795 [Halobacteriovorax marinus]|uniref:Uncharacterized protein n=1 Tax=Halobacteriovorax marinus TaxID=97084 RepID=A0A1Y5F937_9BACT|nr:hypothetical protein A9Q84_13795 [Halobacteriovorax marinus]